MKNSTRQKKIEEFLAELGLFAHKAEETLQLIEQDKIGNRGLFSVFSNKMVAIRGTALQLELGKIAEIAGLGEEIAWKATNAETTRQVRKCIGSLWDALTTVKFMLVHTDAETTEEQAYLITRLQDTLRSFGGAREVVNAGDIEALLNKRDSDS